MSAVPAAQFFKYGPAQAFGPDFNLSEGQRVKMLQREFGFSRVLLANGQSGYIATEDLKPAPPEPTPRLTASPALFPAPARSMSIAAAGQKKRSSGATRSQPLPEPKLDLSDVPSPPLPTDPEKPAPKMRF